MRNEYEAIIIGVGPAGIFAGRELGLGGIDALLIEKGKPIYRRYCPMVEECYHCVSCHEIEGIGGAGGYSDGKLCNGPVGIEKKLLGDVYQDEVRHVNDVFRKTLGERYKSSTDDPLNCSIGNLCQEVTEVVPLGTRTIRSAFDLLYEETPIDKVSGQEIERVRMEHNQFVIESRSGRRIKTKYLLIATGKCDFSLRSRIIDDFGIETLDHFPTLGARLEVPNEQLSVLKESGNNPKIKKFYHNGEYVKTHCFCYAGEVMAYVCGPYFLVGGRSDIENPTPFSNVNILYRSNTSSTTESIVETLERISRDYPKNVICQNTRSFLGDGEDADLRVNPCRGEIFGDLKLLYPSEILYALQDFTYSLEDEIQVNLSGGLLHGPAAEWINPNINVSFEMESSVPNMFWVKL